MVLGGYEAMELYQVLRFYRDNKFEESFLGDLGKARQLASDLDSRCLVIQAATNNTSGNHTNRSLILQFI